jgi:hypothetical protein
MVQKTGIYSNIPCKWSIVEKENSNTPQALNLNRRVITMGTYKRTNGVNWCFPAMHKDR